MSNASEIEYTAIHRTGQRLVRGTQVGRFAVRQYDARERHGYGADDPSRFFSLRAWAVDHIPSGLCVCDADTAEDAAKIADDLSRFSAQDPDATTVEALTAQLGPRLIAWVDALLDDGKQPLDYREWLRTQVQP